jgi:hypothetical protein
MQIASYRIPSYRRCHISTTVAKIAPPASELCNSDTRPFPCRNNRFPWRFQLMVLRLRSYSSPLVLWERNISISTDQTVIGKWVAEIQQRKFSVQSTFCRAWLSYTIKSPKDRHFQELTERYLLLLLASLHCSSKYRWSECFCAIRGRAVSRSKEKEIVGTKG